jgi:hypothetical protein
MSVTVFDEAGNVLEPCTERRARILLDRNRACVVKRNPFTIRLVGGSMTTQENLVESSASSIKLWSEEIVDPVQSWNFDIFADDKPLWLMINVNVLGGKMVMRQYLNDRGMYDLSGKTVRVVFYTDVPSIATEISFSLGKIEEVNLSCDALSLSGCAEVEAIYSCKFVSVTNPCEKNSAWTAG